MLKKDRSNSLGITPGTGAAGGAAGAGGEVGGVAGADSTGADGSEETTLGAAELKRLLNIRISKSKKLLG